MEQKAYITDLQVHRNHHETVQGAGITLSFDHPRIGYVIKGTADFLYRGKSYTAREGDLIYIAVGTKYSSIWYGSPEVEFYTFDFSFNSKRAFYGYRFCILRDYPRKTLDQIYTAAQNSHLEAIGSLYLLINDLFNKMESDEMTIEKSTIAPAVEYLENRYMDKITVAELAALCHCSESRFFALFKETTGVSPIHYKHNIAIQNALNLLVTTELSIEEISLATGFTSSNYFRTVFTKITGTQPLNVRKGR